MHASSRSERGTWKGRRDKKPYPREGTDFGGEEWARSKAEGTKSHTPGMVHIFWGEEWGWIRRYAKLLSNTRRRKGTGIATWIVVNSACFALILLTGGSLKGNARMRHGYEGFVRKCLLSWNSHEVSPNTSNNQRSNCRGRRVGILFKGPFSGAVILRKRALKGNARMRHG